MQLLSLIAAIIVGIIVGCVNAMVGMSTGYDATSFVFVVILPIGSAVLGIPAGFAAGWFDASHKGQTASLLPWAIIGGLVTIAAYYAYLYVQSGAMQTGMGYGEFITFAFENTYDVSAQGYLDFAAAALGAAIGMTIGTNMARNTAGTTRMPYHFEDIADVLVAMVGIDGSIDEDEKAMAALGLQISLGNWFNEPEEPLLSQIRQHTVDVIEQKTASLSADRPDLDTQLAKLKAQGEQVIGATCISVFAVAAADDVIDPAEESLLRDIVAKLGLPESAYDEYLNIGKQLVAAVTQPGLQHVEGATEEIGAV